MTIAHRRYPAAGAVSTAWRSFETELDTGRSDNLQIYEKSASIGHDSGSVITLGESAAIIRRCQDSPRQDAPAPTVPSIHGVTACTPPEGSSWLAFLRGVSVVEDNQARHQDPKRTIIMCYVRSVDIR